MLKISNIGLDRPHTAGELASEASKLLGVPADGAVILKSSVDSRKKDHIKFVYTVAVSVQDEASVLRRADGRRVSLYEPEKYAFPYKNVVCGDRPVVVGMGPAGLFAALSLAEAGVRCIVLERGRPVERRTEDVERFWRTGALDETSNVQFGEGGAGTFSDGKLQTGTNDVRIRSVLETFVRFGAPEDIMYLSGPHIGTDRLALVVKNMRLRLLELGCDVRFENTLRNINIDGGALRSVTVLSPGGEYELPARRLILAPGNSSRDTFRMLERDGAEMEPKNFAVGVRIEHRQSDVDRAQYGKAATLGTLPASGYKLAVHLEGGRSVFTFCVCPGGRVVAASSEAGHVVTNGMSEYARDGENINGGLLVGVSPEDFGGRLFGGMEFQSRLERDAFDAGGADYRAPAQLVGDFLARRPSEKCGRVKPSYTPGVRYCNLWDVLPDFVCESIASALPEMDRKIKGFASPDAVLTAVETRSSSPVRVKRDENYMSSLAGVFPCGEGAGFAGGITSAAVDGIKCAEAVCARIVSEPRTR